VPEVLPLVPEVPEVLPLVPLVPLVPEVLPLVPEVLPLVPDVPVAAPPSCAGVVLVPGSAAGSVALVDDAVPPPAPAVPP